MNRPWFVAVGGDAKPDWLASPWPLPLEKTADQSIPNARSSLSETSIMRASMST
jgi:hypothetical protein